ncbi:hypothetical protein [uncultured Microbacterium sp.]|uniref:hypothetical protein n=1 Tax=uncultured Microbacterium sp. TaxID=191216 RepID=UPI0028D684BB|nr:hypothetical protein [uncultured Microbacterium sp.]
MSETRSSGGRRSSGRPARFALRRTMDQNWVIVDADAPELAVRPLAHIRVDEDDMAEVTWTAPLPLPVIFATPQDAVESLERWERPREGPTKPIPIPAFPPPRLSSASA